MGYVRVSLSMNDETRRVLDGMHITATSQNVSGDCRCGSIKVGTHSWIELPGTHGRQGVFYLFCMFPYKPHRDTWYDRSTSSSNSQVEREYPKLEFRTGSKPFRDADNMTTGTGSYYEPGDRNSTDYYFRIKNHPFDEPRLHCIQIDVHYVAGRNEPRRG